MNLASIVSLLGTAVVVGLLYSLFTVWVWVSFRDLHYSDIWKPRPLRWEVEILLLIKSTSPILFTILRSY